MSKKEIIFIVSILIFTFFSRVFLLEKRGLLGDEKYSVLVSQFLVQEGTNQTESLRNPNSQFFTSKQFWAKKNHGDFLNAMARRENGSGAAYFLLLHYWSQTFGLSDFSLRFPSLLFGLGSIFLLFLFTKKLFPSYPKSPFIVIILAACSPFLLVYHQLARNYSMTIFLVLLSTYLFWLLVHSAKPFYKSFYFWAYSISITFTIFGHHSAIVVVVLHGFLVLTTLDFKKTIPWGLTLLLPVSLFYSWSTSEGGKYTLDFVKNSKIQYLELAKTGLDKAVQFSTYSSIYKQFLAVFSHLYFPISGISAYLFGSKNLLLAFLLSIFIFIFFKYFSNSKKIGIVLLGFVILSSFLFSFSPLQFIALSFGTALLFVVLDLMLKHFKDYNWRLCVVLGIFPILFLVLYAIMDGITMRINPRYASFAYLFLLILTAISIETVYNKNKMLSLIGMIFILGGIILTEWLKIIEDRPTNYFQYVAEPRTTNPYYFLAQKIEKEIETGDTLVFCSQMLPKLGGKSVGPVFSLQDAQYTNLYLKKNGTFIQTYNLNETNKVFIVNSKRRKKLELIDLTYLRY